MLDTSRDSYEKFYWEHVDMLPIFSKPSWMDAATHKSKWLPLTIKNNESQAIGICPFQKKSKFGIPYYTSPMLSPKAGLWINPSFDLPNDFPNQLQKALPFHVYFLFRYFQDMDDIEILQGNAIRKKLHTFVLDTNGGFEDIKKKLHKTTKRNIRVAKSRLNIELNTHQDAFLTLYMKSAQKKGFLKPNMHTCLKNLLRLCIPTNGTLLCAFDEKNTLEAGLFIVFDENRMYGVASAVSDLSSNNHASRMLLWEAIKLSQSKSLLFDFGGGNIPSIGRFFQSFGAQKEEYIQHTVYRNTLIKNYFS